jgi:hypothetical protein
MNGSINGKRLVQPESDVSGDLHRPAQN